MKCKILVDFTDAVEVEFVNEVGLDQKQIDKLVLDEAERKARALGIRNWLEQNFAGYELDDEVE